MKFELKHIKPHPIPDHLIGTESVWKKEQEALESPAHYMILASSGKGKSTFVSYLYGERNDYDGELLMDGRNVRDLTLSEWAAIRRNRLSVVFQDMRLFAKLNVMENLLIKNRLTDYKTEAEIMELVKEYGMEEKTEQVCGTLSLGQQQRVAIIRSLLQPIEFLIMDEPFSHLDQENIRIGCHMIMREVRKAGGGIISTTLGDPYEFKFDHTITI